MTTAAAAAVACAAPGCARAYVSGRLCSWHKAKLGQTLTDLRGDLTAHAAPAITGWRTGGGSGGVLASERDPINLRVIDAQAQAPPILAAWAVWLCAQRPGLSRPGSAEGDRKLLAAELDWIVAQPEIVEFWCQMRALWAGLRGHLPVRRCTCVDPASGQHGPVWSEPGGGWCSWCGTSWTGRALLELARPEEAA